MLLIVNEMHCNGVVLFIQLLDGSTLLENNMLWLLFACVNAEKLLPEESFPEAVFSCPEFAASTALGTVQHGDLTEASGIGVDPLSEIIWAHNDSGDFPRIFAFDATGTSIAEVEVPGAPFRDWEDMSIVRSGDTRSFVYVGDIGDNARERESITIIRFPVPSMGATSIDAFDVFHLQYPDGPHDAEGLLVHPQTGELYIVTKPSQGGGALYRPSVPLEPGENIALAHVVDLDLPSLVTEGATLITGADFSPDGQTMAIRTYTDVYFFASSGIHQPLIWNEGGFCHGTAAIEEQGEAITFSPDGNGYYTISEGSYPAVNWVSLVYP